MSLESQKITLDKNLYYLISTGIANDSMRYSIEVLFKSFRNCLDVDTRAKKFKILFVGTTYSGRHQTGSIVKKLARKYNLEDFVDEYAIRVSYLESLRLMHKSTLLLLLGSDDLNYMPSKFFSYILSGTKVLSLMHKDSGVSLNYSHLPQMLIEPLAFSISYFEINVGGVTSILLKFINKVDVYGAKSAFEDSLKIYTAEYKTQEQVSFFNHILNLK
jgi:hypothetical protein